jgi:hypothetical protein
MWTRPGQATFEAIINTRTRATSIALLNHLGTLPPITTASRPAAVTPNGSEYVTTGPWRPESSKETTTTVQRTQTHVVAIATGVNSLRVEEVELPASTSEIVAYLNGVTERFPHPQRRQRQCVWPQHARSVADLVRVPYR